MFLTKIAIVCCINYIMLLLVAAFAPTARETVKDVLGGVLVILRIVIYGAPLAGIVSRLAVCLLCH